MASSMTKSSSTSGSSTAGSEEAGTAGGGFDNIVNFRDVGKTVNDFMGKKLIREGLLFRSAIPDDASLRDRDRLRHELGIRTVMDLRTKTEHLNQAKKRNADLKAPAVFQSNAALAEPAQIPGLSYVHINLTGRNIERHTLKQLSWWLWFKFLFLYLFGFRMKAIRIIGREVLQRRGLTGMAVDVIDLSQPELSQALHTFTNQQQVRQQPGGPGSPGGGGGASLPALIHCTQGKDRTGIVVSLTLMALGPGVVPLAAIDHDYRLSDRGLLPGREDRLVEIRRIGLTENFAVVAPDLNEAVARHIETEYGGIEAYLDRIGFGDEDRLRLRELLLY